MLDQFIFMRPIFGWSNHKVPLDNFFLCGSGVHGGGGVSGAVGRNVIKALKQKTSHVHHVTCLFKGDGNHIVLGMKYAYYGGDEKEPS